jgi:uncharacterized protein with von Willebrand factor type A (vWA) domain
MTELGSLLFQVFERLRRQGVPLGVSDYLEAIETIQAGVGLEDSASFKGLCRLLWTKSREDQELFDLAFAELVEPQLPISVTSPSTPPDTSTVPPDSTSNRPEPDSELEPQHERVYWVRPASTIFTIAQKGSSINALA